MHHFCKNCNVLRLTIDPLQAHEDYCEYGKVPCPNAQYGCEERPHLPNLGQHRNECAFKPEKCPYCEVLVGKTKMKVDEGYFRINSFFSKLAKYIPRWHMSVPP